MEDRFRPSLSFKYIDKICILICLQLFTVSCSSFIQRTDSIKNGKNYRYIKLGNGEYTISPDDGFVPDEETAIAIAVAVWSPIYGKAKIKHESPYHAICRDGVWHVKGTIPKPFYWPRRFVFGGTAVAEISQQDGRIIKIDHEK